MTDPGHHQSASGADPEADRAVDPRTSQHELHQLAAARPDLRPALAEHPNAYPGLLQWLGDLGDPAIDAALARRQQTSGPDTGAAAAPAGPSAFEETQEFGAIGYAQPVSYSPHDPDQDYYVQYPEEQDPYAPAGTPYAAGAAAGHQAPGQGYPPYNAQDPYSAQAPYASQPQYAAPVYAEPEERPRRRGGGCILFLLFLLVVLGAAAAVYFLFLGGDADEGIPDDMLQGEEEVPPEDAPADDEAEDGADQQTESPSPEDEEEEDDDDDQQQRPLPDDALSMTSFSAPSENIHCDLEGSEVSCTIDEYFFETPEDCDGPATLSIGEDGEADISCGGSVSSQGEHLEYGEISGNDDFGCVATESHFECWSQQSGNGFVVSRENYELTTESG